MNEALLDEELLSGYLESLGENIVKQMIELYTQQSEIYLSDINEAVKGQSQELWQEHCHKMKGAAGSVGLTKLHGHLVNVEKSEEASEKKLIMLAELYQQNNLAISAFNQWLNAE